MKIRGLGMATIALALALAPECSAQTQSQTNTAAQTNAPKTGSTRSTSQQPVSTPNQPNKDSLIDRLYRLVWPLGQAAGNVTDAVLRDTEKAAPAEGVSRLYLVNAVAEKVVEWRSAAGGVDPVVCSESKILFYRRGAALFEEALRVTKERVSALGSPKLFDKVGVGQLYACTHDEKGGAALWAQDASGGVRILRVRENGSAAWEDAPHDGVLSSAEAGAMADNLQQICAVRPDAFATWIQNHQLLGRRRGAKGQVSLLVDADLLFSGTPNWIGDSDFLFVTADSPE
jgi:hypothetical protein